MPEITFLQKVLEACLDAPCDHIDFMSLLPKDDRHNQKYFPEHTMIVDNAYKDIASYVKIGYIKICVVESSIRLKTLMPGEPAQIIPIQRDEYVITFKGRWKLHQLHAIDLLNN